MKYLAILLALTSTVAQADVVQLTVKRVTDNVYQTSGYQYNYSNNKNWIVQTEYCSESAYSDTPVSLVYDRYNTYNNRLIFANGRECRVKAVYTEQR